MSLRVKRIGLLFGVVVGVVVIFGVLVGTAFAGTVTFDPPTRIATFSLRNDVSVSIGAQGDFDEDGNLDVVVVKSFTFLRPQYQQTRLVILFGNGTGGIRTSIEIQPPGARDTFALKTDDVNNDGHLDIVTANNNSRNVTVVLGNGDGTFATGVSYPVWGFWGGRAVGLGDLNGDGYLDIVGGSSGGETTVLLNDGDGTFTITANHVDIAPWSQTDIAVVDLDGDGDNDVVAADVGNVDVFLNDGTGALSRLSTGIDDDGDGSVDEDPFDGLDNDGDGSIDEDPPNKAIPVPTGQLVLEDFDGDGAPDIATPSGWDDTIKVYPGNGDGTFGASTDYPVGSGSWTIASADFDGDGELDLVVTNTWSHNVSVLLGDGAGSFTAAMNFPDPLDTGILAVPLRVLAGDMNGDGKPDLLTLNNDSGPRPPNATVMLNTSEFNPNNPPTADAGPDQSDVEWVSGGPQVSLDGSGSSDDDGDSLSYSWAFVSKPLGSAVSLTGADTVTPSFTPDILGDYVVQLVVNDGTVDSDPDTVTITVQDTTAPTPSAALVPVPGKVEEDEGLFTAVFSCSDSCDANPSVVGVVETPSLTGLEVKLKTKKRVAVKFDLEDGKVKIEGPDPSAILAQLQNGGLLVSNGQLVKVDSEDDGDEYQYKFKKDGTLQVNAPWVSLRVTCTDASGNVGSATAQPVFGTDDDDSGDSDDDDSDDGDSHDDDSDEGGSDEDDSDDEGSSDDDD